MARKFAFDGSNPGCFFSMEGARLPVNWTAPVSSKCSFAYMYVCVYVCVRVCVRDQCRISVFSTTSD